MSHNSKHEFFLGKLKVKNKINNQNYYYVFSQYISHNTMHALIQQALLKYDLKVIKTLSNLVDKNDLKLKYNFYTESNSE